MQLIKKKLPKEFQLYLFGDSHEGNILKSRRHYQAVVDEIASNKKAYAIHMGDMIDCVASDDKRYHHSAIDPKSPLPLQQAMVGADELEPIKKKLLGIHDGNHEWKLWKHGNLTRDIICARLGVPYAGAMARTLIQDSKSKTRFKIFTAHGYGSLGGGGDTPAKRKMMQMNALRRKLERKADDCLVMAIGHTHMTHVFDCRKFYEPLLIEENGKLKEVSPASADGRVHPDRRIYCSTGSFLKGYSDHDDMGGFAPYPERGFLNPNSLGYVKLYIDGDTVVHGEEVIL